MKKRRNQTLLRLVLDAMFIALYVVLSFFLSVRIPPLIKISWASLPLLVAAFLFRPVDALAVAFCGSFLEQLLSYGIGPTTPVWMAPAMLHALFVSLLAPLCRKGHCRVRQTVLIAVSEFFLTFTNTAALYLDAKIVGYSLGAITVVLPTRLLNGGIRAVLSAVLVPVLLVPLTRLTRQAGLAHRKKRADAEAIAYIHAHQRHPDAVGLSRIRELLEKCNNPQNGMRFVHIAGTNGKGSVSAMTASVLRKCGYRTGLFISPYLVDFNERIQVNGKPIPPRALTRLVEKIRPIADAMETSPTEFELITAIGFLYFKERKCDAVVLEVGLGGRLDPTNIIEAPALCVITGIAMDHTAVLGDTVEKIAAEKAGILKHGTPVVWGGENAAARRVIEAVAAGTGAPFSAVEDTPIRNAEFTLSGVTEDFGTWQKAYTPLLGMYQAKNLATVLKAVELLRTRGFCLPEKKVRRGLASVHWQGRFERLSENPAVFFDGAHNPQGVAAARESMECYFPGEKVLLLTGVMADKDHGEMVKILAPVAEKIFTVTPDNPRALQAEALAGEWQAAGVPATAYDRVDAALSAALAAAKETGRPLFVLGSLYLYGSVSAALAALGQ